MKRVLIALAAVLLYSLSYAQTNEDYFKFDDNGLVSEFKITYKDGTVINFKRGEIATVNYKYGVIVDFSHDESLIYDWAKTRINGLYKTLRGMDSIPLSANMPFSCYNICFPDNSSICLELDATYKKPTIYHRSNDEYGGYIDVAANGDSEGNGRVNCHIGNCFVSGKYKGKDYGGSEGWTVRDIYEGTIHMNDNKLYEGTFFLVKDQSIEGTYSSPYLETFFLQYFPNSKGLLKSITGFICQDGRITDQSGNIVGMYKNGKELDEFDLASVLAAEQGKLERELAAAQERKAQRDNLDQKYGKEYVDAMYNGEVIVGMPWDLVELGISTQSFKKFTYVTLDYDRGNSKRYTLRSYGFSRPGYISVRNGKVESVSYYY
ncbi:MAG: hypothetical protein IKX71_03825 [Bacteroidales bacterium]|nr:hypothetical protein [Bacteroidales bacterium]